MGANSNPGGSQETVGGSGGASVSLHGGGGSTANPSNGAAAAAAPNSATLTALRHDPGLSFEWSAEEQQILEEGLAKYASEKPPARYAKIAKDLQGKTVRDVALRCKWMNKKESAKKRKEDHNLSRKSKDKKERSTDPSAKPSAHLAARPNLPPYSLAPLTLDNDDDIPYKAIGGTTGHLLESIDQILKQVSLNLSNLQVQENIQLFCQARNNISKLLSDISDMPGVMQQMPPLPVKINEELANTILPQSSVPMQTS